MSFDPAVLMVSFVFSVIGLYYFRLGKRDSDIKVIITSLAMMIYGYFVTGLAANIMLGIGLWALAYAFRNSIL